jgi:CHAT domain-containing protein/tetratricopeptide (TPR) repeat protein
MGGDEPDLSFGVAFDAICPLCGTAFRGQRWQAIDMDHRPELCVRAMDGSLQRSFCPSCIGPGVEQAGTFVITRRAGAKLQVADFVPWGATDIAQQIDALHARMREHFKACGIDGDSIEPVGSARIEDVESWVEDAWPDFRHAFDPTVMHDPLLLLLNAADAAAHASVLLAHPDLARPNIERLLGYHCEQGNARQKAAAAEARAFVSDARRIGLTAARQHAEALHSPFGSLAQGAPELAARLQAFVLDHPQSAADVERAIDVGVELAHALANAGATSVRGGVLSRVGDLYRNRIGADRAADLAAAIGAYEQALDALDPQDAESRYTVLMNLSACWDLRPDGERGGNIERALVCTSEAERACATLAAELQAEAAMEVGILYTRRLAGDPGSNLALAREALQRAMSPDCPASLRMLARYNLALTYTEDDTDPSGGRLDAGIAMLQVLAGPLAIDLFDQAQQQNLFQSLGVSLAKRASAPTRHGADDLDHAAAFGRKALALAQSRGEPFDVARLASLLARIETDRRMMQRTDCDPGDIMALVDQAARIFTFESAPFEFARNETRRAGILRDLVDPEFADPLIARALEDACRVLTPDPYPDLCRHVRFELGRLHLRCADLHAAAQDFSIAGEACEHVLAATETVSRRAAEVELNAELFAALVDTLARIAEAAPPDAAGDAAWRVLEAMERGRARLYLDMMGLRPLPPFEGVPASLCEREAKLIAELDWCVPSAARTLDAATAIAPERLRHLRGVRAALEALWDDIARCGAGGQRHASLRRGRPPDRAALASFAAGLGPRAATISFFVLPDRVLAVLLRDGAPPQVRTVPLTPARLRKDHLASFAHDVLAPEPPPHARHAWLALGDLLFGPFVEALAGLDLLVVVPHSELHALPLHALPVAGRALIEHLPVVYGSSIGVLAAVVDAERGDTSDGKPLVLSHALTAEEAAEFEGEADSVAQLLAGKAQHHAVRSTLVDSAAAAGLIHLACHGYFDPSDPMHSGVLLSDGVMTAQDWLALRLSSKLVTLSACDTGQQEVRRGDELLGLGRALLQAGSASVLLTLWRVYSDSTADWMIRFYGAWAESPKARWARACAFQRATLELRASDPDPRAWAPFVLIGDPG